MTRPKDIGTAAESAVVRWLQTHGAPAAERRALRGVNDAGDIAGVAGVCWSVKGGKAAQRASDGQVEVWLAELETQRRHAGADVGVLVMSRAGIGGPRAGAWWAVMRLWATSVHLRLAHVKHEQIGPVDLTAPVRVHLSTAWGLLQSQGVANPFR